MEFVRFFLNINVSQLMLVMYLKDEVNYLNIRVSTCMTVIPCLPECHFFLASDLVLKISENEEGL
jgi:hypothetical protein